jgi:hypothetical protein
LAGKNILRAVVLAFLSISPLDAAKALDGDGNSPLRAFLQAYLKDQNSAADPSTRYSAAPVSLNGGSRNIFVYVAGRDWCGSGGCRALLLKPNRNSFKVIEEFTLVRLPVRVLPSRTNGWRDIAMLMQGGGILHGHFVILRFDGSKYPQNPSLAPSLASTIANSGAPLPLSEQGKLLY